MEAGEECGAEVAAMVFFSSRGLRVLPILHCQPRHPASGFLSRRGQGWAGEGRSVR